jgi:DNA-binding CsgD family transcriptional regulator
VGSPSAPNDRLERGRAAFEARAWAKAFEELSAADREASLDPEDLERLAAAAYLTGRGSETTDAWARAHHDYLGRGDVVRAVRCSYWVGWSYVFRGEPAQGNGWLARSRRLLDEAGVDCVERGYLVLASALQTYWGGDPAAGNVLFAQAVEIGQRFREPDLLALARIGLGETFVHLGETSTGLPLLDEVMASVFAGEVSPLVVGLVYCAILACCQANFDTRRAREWTGAFTRWCEAQPDLVPYRGDCLVYRSELLRLEGAWPDAMLVVQQACEDLSTPASQSWAGAAFYQQGELHRLRGEFAEAEEAFLEASQRGREPQPGLSLLRLAQGRANAALAAISRAVAEAHDEVAKAQVLPAQVEILLAAGSIEDARTAAAELARVAEGLQASLLQASSAYSTGAVLLAEGDVTAALASLRKALGLWHALEVPYEGARVRALLAGAYQALGDEDGAKFELDGARRVFLSLGALPDAERATQATSAVADALPAGLTRREAEVLRLVAAGKTNHAIAVEMVLSDHTVRRHLQNVFAKLGVSSRAAATAFAAQHKLV